MDNYTSITKENLEKRFEMTTDGVYHAHQPIYGYRTSKGSTSGIARYMITKSILNAINKYNFKTFIDIGGAEGYTANLVKEIFKVEVKSTDLSENACKMAKAIFGIDAIPADIHNLPFNDNEFDIVLCSETLEHVTDYKKAILELLRITKKVLVVTVPHETEKIVAQNIKAKIPHAHIHYFDIRTLDYLKERGYTLTYEKTLSPLLVIPRVIAEGYKKPNSKIHFKIYNFFTPIFRKLFGIKTANWFTNIDVKMTKLFGLYQGITFTIAKEDASKRENVQTIKAENFTAIKVDEYKLK
ncbi:MAG TPA: class I SAM-dependent methyltransferase [Ginsengibacter sp.]